ncbi:MAG: L-threonine 3-dehydrogenase [Oscillospiraceae bacterium]|nr:L-threonine 3-dehydrogenase [Oscillospiraceae bacterium]
MIEVKKTMLALVKNKPAPGLVMKETPIPEPGPQDVLLRIKKTSICGTDVHIYNWDEWAEKHIITPRVIGHEFVGEIVDVGSHVGGFKPGERVSGEGHIVCGVCRNCLAGRRHFCPHTEGVGVQRNGAFAEYLSIPASNVWRCSPDIDDDIVSCFDPLGNAVHTALTFDLTGEDVLITGAGPIGVMAAAVCRHVGARYIVVTDINPYRLELAARMGASRVVNVREQSIEDVMRDLNMKEGFDVGLEMSGSSSSLRLMVDHMFNSGRIALLGFLPEATAIDWNKLILNSLTVKGVYGREMFETWYKMTAMLQSGLDINPVITHRFAAQDYEKGFEVMNSGLSGKVILDWTTIN